MHAQCSTAQHDAWQTQADTFHAHTAIVSVHVCVVTVRRGSRTHACSSHPVSGLCCTCSHRSAYTPARCCIGASRRRACKVLLHDRVPNATNPGCNVDVVAPVVFLNTPNRNQSFDIVDCARHDHTCGARHVLGERPCAVRAICVREHHARTCAQNTRRPILAGCRRCLRVLH